MTEKRLKKQLARAKSVKYNKNVKVNVKKTNTLKINPSIVEIVDHCNKLLEQLKKLEDKYLALGVSAEQSEQIVKDSGAVKTVTKMREQVAKVQSRTNTVAESIAVFKEIEFDLLAHLSYFVENYSRVVVKKIVADTVSEDVESRAMNSNEE